MFEKMYSSKLSSIILGFLLYFSSIDATNANIDPSTYMATLKLSDGICFGGIIGKKTIISIAGCFVNLSGEIINYTSVTAILGSVEVPVEKVLVPKDRNICDYAIAYLEQRVELEKYGLTSLAFPNSKRYHWGLVGKAYSHDEPNNYTIVESENCPSFIWKSHFCVELLNPNDHCLHKIGSPMVVQGENRLEVIGIYHTCYENSAHEIFVSVALEPAPNMYHYYNSTHKDQAPGGSGGQRPPPPNLIESFEELDSNERKAEP